MGDDKQHEQHECAKAKGHAEMGDLFFRVAKHGEISQKLFSAILTQDMLQRNNLWCFCK
jgi:hypothetical protein